MRADAKRAIGDKDMDQLIEAAARAANYEHGFGVRGCDLTTPRLWWAAYTRQSGEDQAQNNRLPEYLRTCAQEARHLGVVVPREYVFYDTVTGEHLDRPDMVRLRALVAQQRLTGAGVIFPGMDRLSREPLHQQIFEMEAAYYRVRPHYAGAPNGDDPGSQMTRALLAHAAKLVKLSIRANARAGNIGRTLKGSVPAHRAAYGYRYRADKEIGPNGRVIVRKAWWEIDELGPDGKPLRGSPAWVVMQV